MPASHDIIGFLRVFRITDEIIVGFKNPSLDLILLHLSPLIFAEAVMIHFFPEWTTPSPPLPPTFSAKEISPSLFLSPPHLLSLHSFSFFVSLLHMKRQLRHSHIGSGQNSSHSWCNRKAQFPAYWLQIVEMHEMPLCGKFQGKPSQWLLNQISVIFI